MSLEIFFKINQTKFQAFYKQHLITEIIHLKVFAIFELELLHLVFHNLGISTCFIGQML